MMDTIDLLEAIGSDASLRHLSGDELARRLEDMPASDALKNAAAKGESSALFAELGAEKQEPPQVIQIDPFRKDKELEPDEEQPAPSAPADQ